MVTLRDAIIVGISLLVMGIVLSIGADIERSIGRETTTLSVVNETVTFVNNTYRALAHAPLASVTAVCNDTTNAPEGGQTHDCFGESTEGPTGTFTLLSGESAERGWFVLENVTPIGVMKIVANTSAATADLGLNVTYSHYDTPEYRVANESAAGALELASWQDTITLVIAAAIIMGILIGVFATKGKTLGI